MPWEAPMLLHAPPWGVCTPGDPKGSHGTRSLAPQRGELRFRAGSQFTGNNGSQAETCGTFQRGGPA